MRNLKKVLALVLALVMTMSLVTIANAAEFTDEDDIQYTEAVEVMTTLGVFEGFEDDSFQPNSTLTREQAAKIITYMLLGDNADKVGYSTSAFSDVAATRWSAPYINYCASVGIIAGNGDGTYSPTKPLTGYAFAKMLLGALGYKADIEGFVGAGWNLKVASMAAKTGLLNDVKDFAGNNEISRDQACQLALNTLKATMVVYDGTTIDVTTGESTVTIGNTSYSYVTSNNDSINKNIERTTQGNSAEYYTLEFGEQHYPDLVLNRGQLDDFGRPSNEWVFKKVAIGVYPVAADFEYTTQVARTSDKDDAKLKALGLKSYKLASDVHVVVNGKSESAVITNVADIANYTDNGTLVQLYVSSTAANTITNVVVVKSELMQVKKVASDYVSLARVEDAPTNNQNMAAIDVNVNNVKEGDEDYDVLSALKADDYVVVIPVTTDGGSTYSVAQAYAAESVTGELTNVGTYNTDTRIDVTVGGTKYPISQWNHKFASLDADAIAATKKDVTLYLDMYGNAMLILDAGATSSYMVVKGVYNGLVDGKIVNIVQGWDVNGTELSLNLGTTGNGIGYANEGDLVRYTNKNVKNDGEYLLQSGNAADVYIYDVKTDESYAIKASNSKINLTSGESGGNWVASDIKFIYVTFDDGDVDSISIKSGVQNVSNAELLKDPDGTGAAHSAQAYTDKYGAVKAVVIKQESNDAISSKLLYIKATLGSQGTDTAGKKVYGYTAAINSEEGVEEDVTIYSYKNLSAGTFASYAESTHDEYERFYELKAHNAQGKTTSTIMAGLEGVVDENKGLIELKTITDMDGKTAANLQLDDPHGTGDTANVVRVLAAEWVDMTNNGIDSAKDLTEYTNVKLSMVVNDNPSSDAFRNVSFIIVTKADKTTTPGGGGGSVTSGIIKDTAVNYVDSIDAGYTISRTGNLSLTYTVDVPEWVPDDATVTVVADLYIDDAFEANVSRTGTVKDGEATVRYTASGYDAEWGITLKDVAVSYSAVKVQYLDGDNNADLTGRLAANYTDELSTSTPAAISFTINTSSTDSNLKFSLTGTDQTLDKADSTADDNEAQQIGVTGGSTTIATTANPTALGTGYVTVTVYGLSDITETYSISEGSDLTADEKDVFGTAGGLGSTGSADGATMKALGVDTNASNDTLKITLNKDASIGSGDSVSFSAALTDAASDNYSYDVVVKTSAGDVELKGVKNATAVVGWLKNITGNVTINDIVVTAVAKFAIDEDNTKVIDSKTLQIAFNMAVADETGAALEITDFAAGTGVSVVEIKVIDEKTIQVTLDEDLANNDTVVLDYNKIVSKDAAANTLGANKTIKIAQSGSDYSISSIS